MTDEQAQTIPLNGSTLVRGGGFEAEFKWFTVGDTAFVKHAIHSENPVTLQDLEAFGKTLGQLADGLGAQGVEVRFGVERPVSDAVDPEGEAIAQVAGMTRLGPARVLRRRLPIEADDPVRSDIDPTGRPVQSEADADAWAALAEALPALPAGSNGSGISLAAADRATVVEAPDGSGLVGGCWARKVPSAAAGSPATMEIITVGVAPSIDAVEADSVRRALVLSMADHVAAEGVRTLAVCVADDEAELSAALDSLGFVVRRSRQQYARS